MDPPKFTVSEVANLENGLCRVSLRLSDETATALASMVEHGTECSMSATVVLPAEMLPLVVKQTCGFAVTEVPEP